MQQHVECNFIHMLDCICVPGYLQHLSCDFRPSIRNSALQTLSLVSLFSDSLDVVSTLMNAYDILMLCISISCADIDPADINL